MTSPVPGTVFKKILILQKQKSARIDVFSIISQDLKNKKYFLGYF